MSVLLFLGHGMILISGLVGSTYLTSFFVEKFEARLSEAIVPLGIIVFFLGLIATAGLLVMLEGYQPDD